MAIFIKKEHKKTFFVGRGILDAPFIAKMPSMRRVWEAAPYEHLVPYGQEKQIKRKKIISP